MWNICYIWDKIYNICYTWDKIYAYVCNTIYKCYNNAIYTYNIIIPYIYICSSVLVIHISFSFFFFLLSVGIKKQRNAKNVSSNWGCPGVTFRATPSKSCIAHRSPSRKLYTVWDNASHYRPTQGPHCSHGGNHHWSPLVCLCAQEACL